MGDWDIVFPTYPLLIIAMTQVLFVRDYFWSLPAVWALLGVALASPQQNHDADIHNHIKILCIIAASLLAASGLYVVGRDHFYSRTRKSGQDSFIIGNHGLV